MTGTVIPNSMIIHVSVTVQKSMIARSGINVAAVQIVHRVLPARRVRLAREVLLVLRAPLVSLALPGLKVL